MPRTIETRFLAVLPLTELLVVYIGLKIRICFHELSLVILLEMKVEAAINANKLYVGGGWGGGEVYHRTIY